MFNLRRVQIPLILLLLAIGSIVTFNAEAQVPPQQSGTGVSITIQGDAPPVPPIDVSPPSGGVPNPPATVIL